MSWKRKYIPWYRIMEDELGDLVPHLSDDEIIGYVSEANWLVVPLGSESTRNQAKNRPAPNLYFSIHTKSIHLGLSYQNQPSLALFKNIAHEFHDPHRSDLIKNLRKLGDGFRTSVYKMIRENHPRQQPDYEEVYSFITNTIDEIKLEKLISISNEIREEGRKRRSDEDKNWPPIIPGIDLANLRITINENAFRNVLRQLKPVYKIILNIKTRREIISETEKSKRISRLELRKIFYCPVCHNEYSIEDYENNLFCPVDGSSRATWIRGDELSSR
jgi:hypothetical protein